VDDAKYSIGKPEDVRRWVENRRIANAVEVRELRTTWNSPKRSLAAANQMLALYARVNGWPPPDDAIRWRNNLAVWDRFARLRARMRP
jgi:hypothetical protein